MTDEDWTRGHARTVAIYLNGQGIPDRDELGERIVDDSFLLLINAHHQPATFTLPDAVLRADLGVVIDTADPLLAHTRRRRPAARRPPARPGARDAGPPVPLLSQRRTGAGAAARRRARSSVRPPAAYQVMAMTIATAISTASPL